jgi:hypothetical protein
MPPVEFMARLAILVPPPYFPLVRYHGVFAARSSWRALVTPKPPDGLARPKKSKPCTDAESDAMASAAPPHSPPPASSVPSRGAPPRDPTETPANAPPSPALASPSSASLAHAVPVAFGDPTILTVKHCNRILDGELFAMSSRVRVEEAVLLKRTFGFDALRCPRCDTKMRLIATITEPAAVNKILSHLGLRTEPLPRARARDPTGQERFDFDAA